MAMPSPESGGIMVAVSPRQAISTQGADDRWVSTAATVQTVPLEQLCPIHALGESLILAGDGCEHAFNRSSGAGKFVVADQQTDIGRPGFYRIDANIASGKEKEFDSIGHGQTGKVALETDEELLPRSGRRSRWQIRCALAPASHESPCVP